jgi:uncharacterized delta-60 repeat protein
MMRRIALAGVLASGLALLPAGSAGTASAAPTCNLVPQLRAVTMNQGLGYGTLARGKDTLVRLFLSLPSCAASSNSIALTGGSIAVKNGSTTLGTVGAPIPAPTSPFPLMAPYANAPMVDSTGDPKFLVPGSMLAPAGSTASFTATFSATVSYQSKTSSRDTSPVSGSVTLTTLSGLTAPVTAAVGQRSNALRVLAVPMGDASQRFADTANAAVQNGFTALSRLYPVPAGVGSLVGTTGGVRFSMNAGMLDLRNVNGTNMLPNGLFCGTTANFDGLKAQLAQYLQSWNTANPSYTADRVVGAVDGARSSGAASGCAEGMAAVGAPDAWVRAIPDGSTPSTTGSLMGMELAHTFGGVPTARDDNFNPYHSPNVSADVPLSNRTYNIAQRAYLSSAKTALAFTTNWDQTNTLLETADYAYLLCQLGGPVGGDCGTTGTVGTATGVGASPVFVLSVTTSGAMATTHVVESYFAPGPPSGLDPTSQYTLVQKQGSRTLRTDGLAASLTETLHNDGDGGSLAPTAPVALITASVPFNTAATEIDLFKGSTLLYQRTRAPTAPVVSGTGTSTGCSEGCLHAGSLDPTFEGGGAKWIVTGGGLLLDGNAVGVQSTGKIVLGGIEVTPGGIPTKWTLVRLNADGTIDHSFEPGGQRVVTSFTDHADALRALAIQGDDKIVAAGTACPDSTTCKVALARYNTDGTLDGNFGDDGLVQLSFPGHNDQANAVTIQPGGKILVAGTSLNATTQTYEFLVARFNTDGSLDTSFGGGDGWTTTSFGGDRDIADAVALQADGRIVLAGTTMSSCIECVANDRVAVASYNADGSPDTTFGPSHDGTATTDFSASGALPSGADGASVAIGSSGRILVGGLAYFGPSPDDGLAIAAFTSTGQPDNSFSGNGQWADDSIGPLGTADGITGLALDTNGRIVASGDVNSSDLGDPNSDFVLLRFNADGTLDDTFGDDGESGRLGYTMTNFGDSTTDYGRALALQADGKIIVAGGNTSRMEIARYLAEGQPDEGIVNATVTAGSAAAALNLTAELRLACPLAGGGTVRYIMTVGQLPDSISGSMTTFSFPYANDLPCASGTFEVVATDGFSASNVTSGATTSPGDATPHAPVAAIAYPIEGSSLLESADIALRGTGVDVEDGVLADSALSWSITGGGLGTPRTGTGSIFDVTLPPGDYTATLAVKDSTNATGTDSVSFHVLADADHDGIPASTETQMMQSPCPMQLPGYNPDLDPTNAFADYDHDGIPNVNDLAPCDPATSYTANIDINPKSLNTGSTGVPVTVYIGLPARDLRQLTTQSIQITKIGSQGVNIPNSGVSVTGTFGVNQVATVKFDRGAVVAALSGKVGLNERAYMTVTGSGSAGTVGWNFAGTDSTFVTK